jgi:hypothetical protein
MSSSKFSTPFFKKSPLQGAYSSGADSMVAVSYADVHSKFQNDIAKNVAKAYTPKDDPCSGLEQKLANGKLKEGAYKVLSAKCAEQNSKNKKSNKGSFKNVAGKNPFEGPNVGLSDYEESNKTNPFYSGQGYEGGKFNEVEIPSIRSFNLLK